MYYYNWYVADPIISVIVATIILRGAWRVIKQSVHILMEGTPDNIDPLKIMRSLACIEGVLDIHDLRVWTITSGVHSFTCHLVIQRNTDSQKVLSKAEDLMKKTFAIEYITIQIEAACTE
jgi:cobalt-zinc-cadmium efflux system protein